MRLKGVSDLQHECSCDGGAEWGDRSAGHCNEGAEREEDPLHCAAIPPRRQVRAYMRPGHLLDRPRWKAQNQGIELLVSCVNNAHHALMSMAVSNTGLGIL